MDTLMLNGMSIVDLVVSDDAVDATEQFIVKKENAKCFLCNHTFEETEEPCFMFETAVLNDGGDSITFADILCSIIGHEIMGELSHSTVLCGICVDTLQKFENLEQRFFEMRSHILAIYNQTVKASDFEPVAPDLQATNEFFDYVDVDGHSIDTIQNNKRSISGSLASKPFTLTSESENDQSVYKSLSNIYIDIDPAATSPTNMVVLEEREIVGKAQDSNKEFIMCTNELSIAAEDIIICNDLITVSSDQLSDSNVLSPSQLSENQIENEEESSLYRRCGESFTCVLCNNALELGQKQFMEHMRVEHKTRIFPCEICSDVFFSRQELKQHMHIDHDGVARFPCDMCDLVFVNTQQLLVHRQLHSNTEKQFECDICQKRFAARILLTEHMNRHTGERPYSCDKCSKEFSSKYRLRMHHKIHTDRQRPFKCDLCDKAFLKHPTLLQHRKLHAGEKTFVCDVCSKAFGTKHNLDVHKVLHTGLRPFVCDKCGKSFARRGDIRDHDRTHTGERPFRCDMCPLAFAQRSNLMTHKKSTHMNERLHTCADCGRSFKRRRLLDYHIQSVHTGERPYKCDACGAGFVYPDHLKKHMNIHTGQKPYACEVCSKQFNSRENRNAHRFVHSEKKPYECLDCGASFMRKPVLLAHIKQTNHSNATIIVNQPQINVKQDDEMADENSNMELIECVVVNRDQSPIDHIIENEDTLLSDINIEEVTAVSEEERAANDIMKENIEEMQYLQFDGLDEHDEFTWVDIDGVKEEI